ncbi:MAG: gamma-glutamylcyclotransferase [Candidatus Heimdallarchaeota archaeon]|nr:MAG: gamma-glutamylcyclotransferase [Candidatus Heimdallarchaeota archaeon]
MVNLFIYGSFMKGHVNHKHLKGYSFEKAILPCYRRSWPRSKDTAILIKDIKSSVKGELYWNVTNQDLKRIDRLHGTPHYYKHNFVEVVLLKNKEPVSALIYAPTQDIIEQWLLAEKREHKA